MRSLARRLAAVLLALMIGVVVLLAVRQAGAEADPTYGVMNASGGIYWRSAPDWNTAEAIAGNGFYPGTIIAVHCYQAGAANVPGSTDDMWEQASWVSGPGTGSGWINEHFINDGQPLDQPSPGAPPCPAGGGNGGGGSGGSGGGVGTGGTGGSGGASMPSLVFTVDNAAGGIYYRNSPHWADTNQVPGVGVYNGDRVQLICSAWGDPVGPSSNTAWSYVTDLSRSVGSGWVSEHFINDGALPSAWPAGEPSCNLATPGASSSGTPPPSSGPQSVFYSPDSDASTTLGIGPIGDLNLNIELWSEGNCQATLAANIPGGVSTLAGWSVGRLGPIYFLKAASAAQIAALHRIVLFDPGNTQDFHPTGLHKLRHGDSCDWHLPISSLLANWLRMNSANRLTIFTGADTEEMDGTQPKYHGLWHYYLAGIWNQSFAWQAQICDYESHSVGMSHPDVLKNFYSFVQHPHDGCDAAPRGYTLTPWNP